MYMRLLESFQACSQSPFVKFDDARRALPSGSDWHCGARLVYDRNTGLYWEIKSPEEQDVNFCGNTYTFADAGGDYIEKMNNACYGGYNDWRLPNRDELRSIMDYSRDDCSVDVSVFENCQTGDYWTKNVYKLQPYFGWVIFTGFGCAIAKSMESKRYVMAVRGGSDRRFGEPDEKRFVDNQDGTVTDRATGLMWQKGENERTGAETAEELCAKMTLGGYSDWRLPNIKELGTILNPDEKSEGWFFDVFDSGKDGAMLHYSSSTVFQGHYAWVTNFTYGYDGYYGGRKAPLLYRAVRYTGLVEPASSAAPFVITHTDQTDAFDLKGRPVAPDRIKGLDAERVTLPIKFHMENDGQTVRDENTGLLWDDGHNDVVLPWNYAAAFIQSLNDENYCGHTDWRLPEREELRSIVSYGGTVPAVKDGMFAKTAAALYWSGTEDKLDTNLAWGIYFGYGCCIGYPKTTLAHIRAVCGNRTMFSLPQNERFTVNGDGTVTDKATGLMWMQGETPLLPLRNALEYCTDMTLGGYNDWALPNLKELGTLVNLTEGDVWYFADIFPDTNTKPQGFYQSSTTFDCTFGWGCNFQFGFDGYYADRMNGKYPFRPVRKVR